jgi:hypothetical protein
MDPIQTKLYCREDSEIGHSEKIARVLEAAGGGAGFGGEEARIGSIREEEEG